MTINQKLKTQEGFTLVELVVAVAVFAVVVTAVGSVFVSGVSSQRKNLAHQEVLENGRFVLETMGRAIRQSTVVTSDGSSPSITISHPVKGTLTYTLGEDRVKESTAAGFLPLTSLGTVVSRLSFLVQGNGSADGLQPRVVISLSLRSAEAGGGGGSDIDLQTTVTPRNLQIQ